jgi:hypothetical protein
MAGLFQPGAIGGGAVRGAEVAVTSLLAGTTKGLGRRAGAAGLGGMAAGALGGALIDRLLKAVEKKK